MFSYFSDRLDALGSGQLGNVIEKSVSTLDFIWKNNINNQFEINLSAKNLLNPTVRYVRETTLGDVVVTSANGKGISNYKRGMDLGIELKYKFNDRNIYKLEVSKEIVKKGNEFIEFEINEIE